MKAEIEEMRKSKGADGEPFEGEIPVAEVEAVLLQKVQSAAPNTRFILDDYTHKSEDEFLSFVDKIGTPGFVMFMTAKEDTIKARFMKKNETEELSEEQLADIKADSDANKAKRLNLQKKMTKYAEACNQITQTTDISLEALKN